MKIFASEVQTELQLQNEIAAYCRQALSAGAEIRKKLKNYEEFVNWKKHYSEIITSAISSDIFARKEEMNARIVSSYEFEDFKVENVIFESIPGYEVNAAIYLPIKPGKYPGVICPAGHGAKVLRSYQCPAQVFARNGYIALSFDPPGFGEKQYMNDHFMNGSVNYLTGIWLMTYFVADAICGINYLETRADIDVRSGFTVTGLSGGGLTSVFCAILDERIKFCVPVCCLEKHEKLHLTELYTSCPEQFGPGFISAGIDYVDYICLIAPENCMMISGKQDELYDYRTAEWIFEEARQIYQLAGCGENIRFFVDDAAGHDYTVKMANEVVNCMNRVIKKVKIPAKEFSEMDIKNIDPEKLSCHISISENMFTINRNEANRLKDIRNTSFQAPAERRIALREEVRGVLGISQESFHSCAAIEECNPKTRWFHSLQKIDIVRDTDIHIPGLLMNRTGSTQKKPALLFIDEKGKWEGFRQGGILARSGRFLQSELDGNEPLILSIDITGLGELAPQPSTYDLAPWNNTENVLTYLSVALNKPVMGLRIRDALAALNYIVNRTDVDAERVMVGGRGIGAVVALHAAFLHDNISKVICMDMLSHYAAIAGTYTNEWSQSIIIPGILKYYDLPDIIACLTTSCVYIINPQDERKVSLTKKSADWIYHMTDKKNLFIGCSLSNEKAEEIFCKAVLTEDHALRK
jgi:cephalosporin-C deacetylase-like acetyl esterase